MHGRTLPRSDGGAAGGAFAGVLEAWDDADMGGEGAGASKAGGVVDGGDAPRGRLRTDPVDCGERLADLVGVESFLLQPSMPPLATTRLEAGRPFGVVPGALHLELLRRMSG